MTTPAPGWLTDLRRSLGPAVVDDPEVMGTYARDWTGRFEGTPVAVVRAGDVDDVVAVMATSAEAGFAVVPQGGNTGLVAATIAPEGSVILNLRGLDRLTGPDHGSLLAGAGVTIASAQQAAAGDNRLLGLDMASRDSATVGGAIATNAAGLFAAHWGRMHQQVIGVEAVLADGTLLTTVDVPTLPRAGVDPVGLLAGSEGTLAVITAARLRLHRPLGPTVVVLAGFPALAELLAFLAVAPPLVGAEVFRHEEMSVVLDRAGLAAPLPRAAWYLLLEAEERHAATLEPPATTVVGRDLWVYRDRITESLAGLGVVHKFDVVVPPPVLEELAARLTAELSPLRLFVFGHVLLADFHLNVAPASPRERVPEGLDDIVYAAVEDAGGRAAGEHGVGRVKAERARAALLPGHLRMIDGLKRSFDPDGRLNPGVGPARPWPTVTRPVA